MRTCKWCYTNTDETSIPDDSKTGYVLELHAEYLIELHDTHRDLPLAPEHRILPETKESNLTTILLNKGYYEECYVLYYRNLKLYLSLGIKLKCIHRVLTVSQSDRLKNILILHLV